MVGPSALGVHHALGDALAVLVGELLEQLVVLHQHRAARAGGMEFWLSETGFPAVVVKVGGLLMVWYPRGMP